MPQDSREVSQLTEEPSPFVRMSHSKFVVASTLVSPPSPSLYQMPLPDDVWCFLIGGDSTFSVNIDETHTRTVDHLKKEIRKSPELNARIANSLTLYRVAIDQSHDKKLRMSELTRLSENLDEKCIELDEMQQVSTIFGESPPVGKIYVVLVQTTEGESIFCGGVALMANVAKNSGPPGYPCSTPQSSK